MPSSARRGATAAVACVAAAATLIACGGPSADEYRAEAGEICREAAEATRAVEAPTRSTTPAIVDYFERLVAVSDRARERFDALDAPQDLEAAHDEVVDANRAAADEVRAAIDGLEGGQDPETVLAGAQGRIQAATARAQEAARRLNVPDCTR